ncbi:MAG TPA: YraN family protein [Pusillimonas sp.]|uniref:YraN family protein n=1 Tax=Pusillimonas sp. TaxID=3040095 RepID=UPI002C9F6426|nr:YraN family protein [Pusillimonas sp.]HUH87316.1 YraN family protein [Pusillimonas sp.]
MRDDTSDPSSLAGIAQRKAIRRRRRAARRKPEAGPDGPSHDPPYLSPTQRQGRLAEQQAREHVEAAGARVLRQNLLCRSGEIDLVCLDGPILVFIEVRHRHSRHFGGAAASVVPAKQQRLARAAAYFLPRLVRQYLGGRVPPCRFDVIAFEGEQLQWLKGVFDVR